MSTASLGVATSSRRLPVVSVRSVLQLALVGLLIGNLGRIPVFSTGGRAAVVLANDLLVGMVLCAGFVRLVAAKSLVLDKVAVLAMVFALVGGVSTLYSVPRFGLSAFEVGVSLSYLARWLYYFTIYVVMINAIHEGDVAPLWRTLEVVILIFSIFGILQALFLPNFAQLIFPNSRLGADWDPQGHRLVSTWLDPVFAGMFIGTGLLVHVASIAVGRRAETWKLLVLATALLLTVSRGSLLAVIVGLGVVVLIGGASLRVGGAIFGLAGLLAAGVPAVVWFTSLNNKYTVDVSSLIRVVEWLRALRVFLEHPVIGVGYNAWGFVQERYGYERNFAFSYGLDGGLIFIALMTGLVGLFFYMWMLKTVVSRGRAIARNHAVPVEQRALATGVAAMTVAQIVHALFANSLMLPFLMETTWFLWALLFALARGQAHRERDVVHLDRAATARLVHGILK